MSAVLHPASRRAGRQVQGDHVVGQGVGAVEAAYAEADPGRGIAPGAGRPGRADPTEPGRFVAAVEDPHGIWTVEGSLPVLDHRDVDALVEAVAAESGRVAALLDGELPHGWSSTPRRPASAAAVRQGAGASLQLHALRTGPCVHALAVLQQLAWLVEADPFVLPAAARARARGTCWRGCAWPSQHRPRGPTTPTTAGRRRLRPGPRHRLEAALYAARLLEGAAAQDEPDPAAAIAEVIRATDDPTLAPSG